MEIFFYFLKFYIVEAPNTFRPILNWLENNYIGKKDPNSQGSRLEARFPIRMWNLHDRIKKGLPTTNNLVEVWHGAISADAKKHLTVNKTVKLFRKEQSMTEIKLPQLGGPWMVSG